LVTERLASSGREECERRLAREECANDIFLSRPKAIMSETRAEWVLQIHPRLISDPSREAQMIMCGSGARCRTDTVIKNTLTDFATEHFEIACYNSLIFTAEALGEKQIAATCKRILKEEKAMAAELAAQLKGINDAYLATLEEDEAEEERPVRGKTQRRGNTKARDSRGAGSPSARPTRSASPRKKK
jgi:hypothetical protein